MRRIIDEPTAAALAYGLDKEEDQTLLVYDFGGGTFDVSIIDVVSGVFQVMAIQGDSHLGGDDMDRRIVEHLLREFKEEQGIDLSEDPIAMQRLKEAAEEAKIELSEVKETHILIEAVSMTEKGPLTLDATLTRSKFEELVKDLVAKTVEPVHKALADAKLTKDKLNKILLVGGITRIPMVHRTVKEILGREPQRDLSPEEVVALGAAVQTLVLADGLDADVKETLATRYGKEKPVIIHMTPFSLGVGLQNDEFGVIIERNSTYPTEAKDIFTTTHDFQEAISFPIYEGEEQVASENTFLDLLRIEGITPAPRGVPRIEVTFRLNTDRILQARAEDLATGQEKQIRVEATDNRLTDEEKMRMISEAKARAASSLKRRMQSSISEDAESLIERAESLLAGSRGGASTTKIRAALKTLKGLMDSNAPQDRVMDSMSGLSRMLSELESAT